MLFRSAPAGAVHLWDINSETLPASLRSASTHSFGVIEALDLARTLNRLPAHLHLLGIEIQHCEVGSGFSAPVDRALARARHLMEENFFAVSVQAPSPPHLP